MDKKSHFTRAFAAVMLLAISSCFYVANGQHGVKDAALESITAEELRGHIFFLASDYMGGRIAPTPEYEIAAQYVAAQFAAAGLQPVIELEDGSKSFFQGVPFTKTQFGEGIAWNITKEGKSTSVNHKEDFKILYASSLNHKNVEVVYVGYGIDEPDHKWNDFEGLDVKGKIMVVIGGAPMKNGKPVLPEEIHNKNTGPMGVNTKIQALFGKGAAGIILVDVDGTTGIPFAFLPSQFETEKYVYKEGESEGRSGGIPSIYMAKPEFLNTLMAGNKSNPLNDKENILKGYKPQVLKETYLNSEVEILGEEEITTKNIIGIVPGTDPELKDEFIVVGAHLDHVRPSQGEICNGADDNASGTSGVMEMAEAVAMNPCKRTVVFIAYTAEEMGLIGSRHFVGSGLFAKEQLKFNVNLDMIGRSSTANEESRAHYVVTNKRYVDGIESFINDLNDGITDFPLLIDNDEDSPGGSDHQSFISEDIPAFFFFSGMHRDLHQPGDDADKIDYAKAESITRLGYLIATKLANMETVPSFTQE